MKVLYPSSSAATAYDRAITVFSPDGRLFQVEYAREAVKRGTTAIGIVFKNGGILATDKSIATRLINAQSIEKIFEIDEHMGVATSGLVADARRLVHHARVEAQREKVAFNHEVSVESLTKEICDLKQMYTQYGGTRPFGTALLVMGIDDTGPRLYETDPSGAFTEAYAAAIGSGKKEVEEIFEKEYDRNASFDDALHLAYKVLKKVGDKKMNHETLNVAYITDKDKKFTIMPPEKLKTALSKKK